MVDADRAGNLLELVVIEIDKDVLVIHAMMLRHSIQREIFGGEDLWASELAVLQKGGNR